MIEKGPSCLYPDEGEIAGLVMGKNRSRWPSVAKVEERNGLPQVDPLYGGRYWPAVKAYLDQRHGIRQHGAKPPDGAENWTLKPDRLGQRIRSGLKA